VHISPVHDRVSTDATLTCCQRKLIKCYDNNCDNDNKECADSDDDDNDDVGGRHLGSQSGPVTRDRQSHHLKYRSLTFDTQLIFAATISTVEMVVRR